MAGALMLTVFTGTGCSAQTAARSEEGKTQAEGAGTAETESTGATGDGGVGGAAAGGAAAGDGASGAVNYAAMEDTSIRVENIELTDQWDKVFPLSHEVNHRKVTFVNHFGNTLAADLYEPKEYTGSLPAIAVCGPFGAVKEQSSGLYAQEMARRGFLAIAFDPSFTGESSGYPRYFNSPDINVEDYQAAIDFLSVQENVNPEQIGVIGICGWGGMALQTAALDTRVKAAAAMTMYDMSRNTALGYFDSIDEDGRYQARAAYNQQRTETDRGYHPRSVNSNNGWAATAGGSLMNMRLFEYAPEIRSAVLLVHGEKAHSLMYSQDAYKLLQGSNKELMIIPDATHTDLYDQMDKIPFDKLERFFAEAFQ